MWKITVLLFVLPFAIGSPSDGNNVQRTRTSIKVAKNLDPDAMETLEIKTRTGDVATIVVKKRDGRQQFSGPPADQQPNFQLVSSSNEAGPRVPDPVVIRSDSVYVKNQKDEDQKKSRSLLQVDADGIPVITGVREPDDENDTQVWRNARVINGILVPNTVEKSPNQHATGPARDESRKPAAAPMFNGVWQVYRKKPEPAAENVRPAAYGNGEQSPVHFTAQRDSYDEKYMTDKILGYIKNINGNMLDNGNGRSVRMLEPKAEARVLHAPSVSVFPNSAAYSPKTAPRLTFEESARTPVLQYAHPELGVQAAKYEAPAQAVRYEAPVQTVRYEAGPAPAARYDYAAPAPVPNARYEQHPEEVQRDGRRQQALSYFGHDIHADRSPYAFEPGLEKESRVKVPKKYASPLYGGYLPEKQGKYAPGFHVNGGEASFWTVMKNSVKSSFDKMTDLTRPMVDPLVEATQKITGNLGFSHGNRELTNVVKEKLGMVATPSVLLPALGLVAGGAALGLGAVAVGRYLDYDVIRMRNNDDIIEFQRALNGSYVPIVILPEEQQDNKTTEIQKELVGSEPAIKRTRRALSSTGGKAYTNRNIKKVRLTRKKL